MKTALQHLGVALVYQLVIWACFGVTGLANLGMVVGAIAAISLFYGREHDQEERKLANRFAINHGLLWSYYPKEALKALNPLTWSRGNQLDLLFPCLGNILLVVTYLFLRW